MSRRETAGLSLGFLKGQEILPQQLGQEMSESHQVFKLYVKFFQWSLKNTIRLLELNKQPVPVLPETEIKFLFSFTSVPVFIRSLHIRHRVSLAA